MSFDFMSPNYLSQNMIQSFDQGVGKLHGSGGDLSNPSEFAKKLNTLLDGQDTNCQDFEQDGVVKSDSHLNSVLASLSKDIKNGKGDDFINKLKLYLDASGDKLSDTSVSGKGLKALEKLLVKAGFAKDDINNLMAKLQLKSGNGRVKLSDLFNGLSKLKSKNSDFKKDGKDKGKNNNLLAVSAFPFIESIMTALGIPEDLSDKIMDNAKKGGRGINLDTLIDGLQKLHKKSFLFNIKFKTDPDNKSFNAMLEQMGFLKAVGKNGDSLSGKKQLTLESFISSLEQMRNKGDLGDVPIPLAGNNADNPDALLGLFMGDLKNGANTFKEFGKIGNGIKQDISEKSMGKMSGKGLNNFFSLLSEKKINTGKKFVSKHSLIHGSEADLKMAKLLGKMIENANLDKSIHKTGDGATKFNNVKKNGSIKTFDLQNAAGGALKGLDLINKNFGSIKAASLAETLPSHVANQVARNILRSVYRGDNELSLQLKPPELGRLFIKIDNLGDSMKVSIITDNHAAKDIISSQINNLKTVLAGSGISIGSFDVSMSGNFNQSMANTGNNPGSHSGNRQKHGSGEDILDEIINRGINTDNFLNDERSLHFVA